VRVETGLAPSSSTRDADRSLVTFLSDLPHHLKYRALGEQLAVCRLASNARIPAWGLDRGIFLRSTPR